MRSITRVELTHGAAHRARELVEIERHAAGADRGVPAQVDRAEVTDGRLVAAGDFEDLGAEIGEVDGAAGERGLVARSVGGVLEGHPAVAGLGQRAHHPRVELARLDRSWRPAPAPRPPRTPARTPRRRGRSGAGRPWDRTGSSRASASTRFMKRSGTQLARLRLWVRARLVAGVVAQLEELLDVGVPGLQVHAAGALALAALVHRRHRGVQRLQPGHDAVGVAVGALDQRAARRARDGRRGRCRPRTSRAAPRPCSAGRCSPGCRRASRAGSSSRAARGECPR